MAIIGFPFLWQMLMAVLTLAVILTMAIMKRKSAFLLAFAVGVLSYIPLAFPTWEISPIIFDYLRWLGLPAALLVGSISLVREQRGFTFVFFLFPFVAFAVAWLLFHPETDVEILMFSSAPFLLTLAAVFFAGAFIEKHPRGA